MCSTCKLRTGAGISAGSGGRPGWVVIRMAGNGKFAPGPSFAVTLPLSSQCPGPTALLGVRLALGEAFFLGYLEMVPEDGGGRRAQAWPGGPCPGDGGAHGSFGGPPRLNLVKEESFAEVAPSPGGWGRTSRKTAEAWPVEDISTEPLAEETRQRPLSAKTATATVRPCVVEHTVATLLHQVGHRNICRRRLDARWTSWMAKQLRAMRVTPHTIDARAGEAIVDPLLRRKLIRDMRRAAVLGITRRAFWHAFDTARRAGATVRSAEYQQGSPGLPVPR